MARGLTYTVVVPARDEVANIAPLTQAIREVMNALGEWELIYVDDGSEDGTHAAMVRERAGDPRVKILRFRRNFGQTAAWAAGFDHAGGDIVICLDADLQNDPADIPPMVQKLLEQGYDVISGWRQRRRDSLEKRMVSFIANALRRFITKEKIHDSGCSLKVYRRAALTDLELYGEMHRYVTALLSWKGFRVGELPVRHHPRRAGKTKYNLRRTIKGFLDLLVVKFWMQYSARPIHLFGTIGVSFVLLGFVLGGGLSLLWLLRVISLQNRTSPLLAALLVLVGMQFIMTGILADIVAKNYYATKKVYTIESRAGFDGNPNDEFRIAESMKGKAQMTKLECGINEGRCACLQRVSCIRSPELD